MDKSSKERRTTQCSCRNNYISALQSVLAMQIPNIDEKGIFKIWTPFARNKETWEDMINECIQSFKPKETPKTMMNADFNKGYEPFLWSLENFFNGTTPNSQINNITNKQSSFTFNYSISYETADQSNNEQTIEIHSQDKEEDDKANEDSNSDKRSKNETSARTVRYLRAPVL